MKDLIIDKLQDTDGHWYWIPKNISEDFNYEMFDLLDIEYLDDPEIFDKFNDKWGKYRTGGCSSSIPKIFKSKI